MRCGGRRAAVEHVLVCELHMAVQVLQPGRLAKADELVVDEATLDVVELVHVLHNGLTLILYKVLDKSISRWEPQIQCSRQPQKTRERAGD
jgi:hypothetical protein